MKRLLLAIWLCGCFAVSASLAQTTETKKPKLVIASTEHNIGEVKRGADAKYTFIVKNEGNDDLEIRNVAPS